VVVEFCQEELFGQDSEECAVFARWDPDGLPTARLMTFPFGSEGERHTRVCCVVNLPVVLLE